MMMHNDSCPLHLPHPVLQSPVTSAWNSLFSSVQLGKGSSIQLGKYLGLRTEWTHSRVMPSAEKILYFLSSAVLSGIGVAVLGYGMSTEWATSTMVCTPQGTEFFNGSATIDMGLFKGKVRQDSCPRFTSDVKTIAGRQMMFVKISM